jgi:hypothetical protein
MLEISNEKVKLFNEELLTSPWAYLVLHKDVQGWREGNYDYLTRFCERNWGPNGMEWIWLANGWQFKHFQHAEEFYMEFYSEL